VKEWLSLTPGSGGNALDLFVGTDPEEVVPHDALSPRKELVVVAPPRVGMSGECAVGRGMPHMVTYPITGQRAASDSLRNINTNTDNHTCQILSTDRIKNGTIKTRRTISKPSDGNIKPHLTIGLNSHSTQMDCCVRNPAAPLSVLRFTRNGGRGAGVPRRPWPRGPRRWSRARGAPTTRRRGPGGRATEDRKTERRREGQLGVDTRKCTNCELCQKRTE